MLNLKYIIYYIYNMSFNNFTNFTNPTHYTVNKINSRNNNSNFDTAYNPAQTLIPPRDSKNYGFALHNNINSDIVHESITEYTLHIDAADRDTSVYKNPFVFSVSLGGAGYNMVNRSHYVGNNGALAFQTTPSAGVPPPRIDSDFKNVKYAKIKYLTLPRIIVYQYTIDGSGNKIYSPLLLGGTILSNYRYLIMRIKEIANNNMYSTNDNIKNDCFILYRDSNYMDAINDIWIATQPIKIFYEDDLRNLNKLSIEIFIPPSPPTTQCGSYIAQCGPTISQYAPLQPLNILEIDNSSDTSEKIPMAYDILNGTNPQSDFFSKYGYSVLPTFEIELGVYENQLNTTKTYH